jgi:hypothetical protein
MRKRVTATRGIADPPDQVCSRAEFDWASLEMAAEFLEKPHKIAMEEERWYQPETRENIR